MAFPKFSKKTKQPPKPMGLGPEETKAKPPASISTLCKNIEKDGGVVQAAYREPFGGHWLVLAVLPLVQVEPTPYQRHPTSSHVTKLENAIAKTGLYLDPVIVFRIEAKSYQTPNGNHRVTAMKNQGAKAITALVVPNERIARLILALNTEKAHSIREKALEVIGLARHLAKSSTKRESDYALEFEEPALLTLGICNEKNPKFAGSAYHLMLRRVDGFLKEPLAKTLPQREVHADKLLEIDARVAVIVKQLRARGFDSPSLRFFVIASIDPTLPCQEGVKMPIARTLNKMAEAAQRFNIHTFRQADFKRGARVFSSDGE